MGRRYPLAEIRTRTEFRPLSGMAALTAFRGNGCCIGETHYTTLRVNEDFTVHCFYNPCKTHIQNLKLKEIPTF